MDRENPTVAVVTSTIGRAELERAALSVRAQTYPCRHYVFIDGPQFRERAEAVLRQFPEVLVTPLPVNTGADGWVNSSINAMAPFLVKEDIVCYLDDDNWYREDHAETLVSLFKRYPDLDFAYSLRNLYDERGGFVCRDDVESLGFNESRVQGEQISVEMPIKGEDRCLRVVHNTQKNHIDTNCYAFSKQAAVNLSRAWFTGRHNDQNVFKMIAELGLTGSCSGRYTVNYHIDMIKHFGLQRLGDTAGLHFSREELQEIGRLFCQVLCAENIKRYGGERPWALE